MYTNEFTHLLSTYKELKSNNEHPSLTHKLA